jgi:hypothetical protein
MKKALKVEKEVFERALNKMLRTPPAPRAQMPKSKKKLARVIEPITPTR